jgi:hypothetical protein
MRKELSIGAGLVAVMLAIVGPPFVALSVRPYEPPLRVGMKWSEVYQALGKWDSAVSVNPGSRSIEYRHHGPDWLGGRQTIEVVYENDKVISWEVRFNRTLPPLLEKALKAVGL